MAPYGLVSTVAGGRKGFADGVGATACFHWPAGLAIDLAGDLIVTDLGNDAIRRVTKKGVFTTNAGGKARGFKDGDATSTCFSSPQGVVVDGRNNILFADKDNHIRIIYQTRGRDMGGGREGVRVVMLAGSGKAGAEDGEGKAAQMNRVMALALACDSRARLLVAEYASTRATSCGAHARAMGSGTCTVCWVVKPLPEQRFRTLALLPADGGPSKTCVILNSILLMVQGLAPAIDNRAHISRRCVDVA